MKLKLALHEDVFASEIPSADLYVFQFQLSLSPCTPIMNEAVKTKHVIFTYPAFSPHSSMKQIPSL